MAQKTRTTLNLVSVIRAAIIAGVIASIINVVIFLLAQSQFEDVYAIGRRFDLWMIIGASFGFIIMGSGIMIGLDVFVDNTLSGWRNLSIIALILAIPLPFLFVDFPLPYTFPVLILMQFVAGGIAIYVMTTQVTLDEG